MVIFFNKPIGHQGCEDNNCPCNLPTNLQYLTLGHCFNLPIDTLPNNLTHLTLGNKFNQPVNNLPKSLTHLTLGHNFNYPIDKLPDTLIHLTLGEFYEEKEYSYPIVLPAQLEEFVCSINDYRKIIYLPPILKKLVLARFNKNRYYHYSKNINEEAFKIIKVPFDCEIIYKPLNFNLSYYYYNSKTRYC